MQRLYTHDLILVLAMHLNAPLVDDAVMANDFVHGPLIDSVDVIDAPA